MTTPSVTDWLMVIITGIYMLATIAIFVANLISAKSAKKQLNETKEQIEISKTQFEEQLAETKRQYEETKRLSIMPYLQCEFAKSNVPYKERKVLVKNDCLEGSSHVEIYEIKNIGLGTAKNIKYQLVNLSGNQEIKPFIFQSALSGESHAYCFTFPIPFDQKSDFSIYFDLIFCDLLDNQYSQRIEFMFIRNANQNNFSMESITHGITINSQE